MSKVGPRSQSRMLALQAVCAAEAVGDRFFEDLSAFLADPENHEDLELGGVPGEETLRFADVLARGVWGLRRSIDARLAAAARNWSLERMTPVDRNILRLGVYELMECADTPTAVVIDEAVELAHRFGDMNAPGFVNGVLDAVHRELGELRAANHNH